MSAVSFAFLWVLNNPTVTAAVAGPRTLEHWKSYLDIFKHEFTAEDEALIDSMVSSGHPSTPGYNDPQYPVIGRPTGAR